MASTESGAILPNLPDRSYTISSGAPYVQTDITERLNEAFADRLNED